MLRTLHTIFGYNASTATTKTDNNWSTKVQLKWGMKPETTPTSFVDRTKPFAPLHA